MKRAAETAGGLGDVQKPYSVQLIRFTDENYGPDGGPPILRDRLVWLIRFTGTPQRVYGVLGTKVGPADVAMELNVVLDANTGEFLESFSYR